MENTFFPAMYNDFIKTNHLQNDTAFLSTEYVPLMLKAVGIGQSYAVSKLVEDYYFEEWMMGDLELMTPGSIDVSGSYAICNRDAS